MQLLAAYAHQIQQIRVCPKAVTLKGRRNTCPTAAEIAQSLYKLGYELQTETGVRFPVVVRYISISQNGCGAQQTSYSLSTGGTVFLYKAAET
jgi:hypothetical protein